MDKLITIQTYTTAQQAYLAKSFLENAEITVFLKDELTAQVYNLYSTAVGGVKLQVPQSRAEEALKILEDGGFLTEKITKDDFIVLKKETNNCPSCNSTDISIQKFSTPIDKLVLGFLSLFNPALKTYICNSCNQKWKVNKNINKI